MPTSWPRHTTCLPIRVASIAWIGFQSKGCAIEKGHVPWPVCLPCTWRREYTVGALVTREHTVANMYMDPHTGSHGSHLSHCHPGLTYCLFIICTVDWRSRLLSSSRRQQGHGAWVDLYIAPLQKRCALHISLVGIAPDRVIEPRDIVQSST